MRNRAKCRLCGTVIESRSVHDFQTCRCGAIYVDGGKEYFRRGGKPDNFIEVPAEAS